MKNIRIRKIIPLVLITGVLTLSGCEREGAIQKNTLMTEEDNIQNEASENITEEQAKEIAIKSFKDYFNKEVDIENLFEKIELVKAGDRDNKTEEDSWEISWSTFDYNRLKTIEKMTKDEVKKLNEDLDNAKSYSASIGEKSGNIIGVAIQDGTRYKNMSLEEMKEIEIETEDAKGIALDYIKKHNFSENIESLKFLGDISTHPDGSLISYKHNEDKVIIVSVESISKEVMGFAYVDEQWLEDTIEETKGFKENDVVE